MPRSSAAESPIAIEPERQLHPGSVTNRLRAQAFAATLRPLLVDLRAQYLSFGPQARRPRNGRFREYGGAQFSH